MNKHGLQLIGIGVAVGLILILAYLIKFSDQDEDAKFYERESKIVKEAATEVRPLVSGVISAFENKRKVVQATPNPTPPAIGVSQVLQYVSENDACSIIAHSLRGELTTEVMVLSLKELPGFQRLNEDGRAFLRSHASQDPKDVRSAFLGSRSDLLDFYEGLLISGQYSVKPAELNHAQAKSILERLDQKFPDNGVYAYHLLYIENELNAPDSKLEDITRRVLNAKIFDSFENQLARELALVNLGSRSEMSLALFYVAETGIPEYIYPMRVMNEVLKKNPILGEDFVSFAKRVMSQEEARARGPEFLTFSAVRYMVARFIGKLGWRSAHGDAAFPKEFQKHYKELAKKNLGITLPPEVIEGLKTGKCDSKVLESEFQRIKSLLQKYEQAQ